MKRRIVILLCALLLACQPTPEKDAVKQKDTNVLIDTVRAADDAATTAQPTQSERFVCDTSTSRGNVHISADVPIEVLSETGAFPVLRVAHRYLTDAERLTVAKRLLNSDTLWLHEVRITRAMLEQKIRDLIEEPTPEEKAEWLRETGGTEADWERAQAYRQSQLAAYQKQYSELPADDAPLPLTQWDGAAPTYSEDYANHRNDQRIVRSATDTDYLEHLDFVTVWANEMDRPIEFQIAQQGMNDLTSVWFFCDAKEGTVRIDPQAFDRPYGGASVSPNEAIETVTACFDGVNRFRVTDVFWTNNGTENENDEVVVTREAYLVVLTTDFRGANTVYSRPVVYEHDAETDVVRSWANEALMAAVDGDGKLLSLVWLSPLKVTETVSEAAKLLSVDEIKEILVAQLGRMFTIRSEVAVTGVQLGLYRIREQNSFDAGLLVPVWFFTGEFRPEGGGDAFVYDNLNPLLIVNAIDGSIIDPQKGY